MDNRPPEPTFRDFAAAVMSDDDASAAAALRSLLSIDTTAATQATAFFKTQMAANPQFMMQAMGLRTAVESGSAEDIGRLLKACFNLDDDTLPRAVSSLQKVY